jgi:hypothetical protein
MTEQDMTVQVPHPDLDQAVDFDDHGPIFEATFEGLDADDDTAVADG